MQGPILRLVCALLLAAVASGGAQARIAKAHVDRIVMPMATLEGVGVRLEWPAQAQQGELQLRVARLHAPDLGYRFVDVHWRCPLQRTPQDGWRCEGELRSGRGAPMRLAVDLGTAVTAAALQKGPARLALHRNAASPDLTRIDLTRVPLAWAQALLSKAWKDGRITGGTLDGRLDIVAAQDETVRVSGPMKLHAGAFDTPDGTIAAEGLSARIALEMAIADRTRFALDGDLGGGELLFGNAYLALQQRNVGFQLEGAEAIDGWNLSRIRWEDPGLLNAEGSAFLEADASVRALDMRLRSPDLAPVRDAYLSGWLGVAGLSQIRLAGAAEAQLQMDSGTLRQLDATLHQVTLDDPDGRFGFDRLDGDLRYSSQVPVQSALGWQGGTLYGLAFGPARLPLASGDGAVRLREAVAVPLLGGQMRFDHMQLRPPSAGEGLDVRFGMTLDRLDVGQLTAALEWPAFSGELSGAIPVAHYRNERLDFDGGLRMQVFDGDITVSALAMERPFGVAPTLSADIALDDLDLEALTGVFGFGSITGRLDGRIAGLRMVDWQPTAFDAALQSDRKRGVRQRISQRAVQDLSSVGDASFATSLQSQVIGLFDDFGYARIGISCRLLDDVCAMDGLRSAGRGFIIVEGAGLPRLTVVGFNRRVDWPTLVERLGAIGKGDVKPVVE